MDDKSYDVLVYDWRAPIASMFYRNEIGAASYQAPCGEIRGEVSLKRQYEIEKGELKYYFLIHLLPLQMKCFNKHFREQCV